MSDQPSVELFDQLVERLRQTGMRTSEVSMKLGYSGRNPKRDLTTVAKGSSRTCSLPQACGIMSALLEGKPAAPPPSAPTPAEAPPDAVRERYQSLIQRLVRGGMTTGAISVALGYSGSNPRRDLDTVGRGGSRRCTVENAIAMLEQMAKELPEIDMGDDGNDAALAFGLKQPGVPPPSEPKPDPSVVPIDHETLPGNPKLRFDRLVQILVDHGKLNRGGVSIHLGYSGWNGARDLVAVREGKCKLHSVISACIKLQQVLERCGLLTKDTNADATEESAAAVSTETVWWEEDGEMETADAEPATRQHSFESDDQAPTRQHSFADAEVSDGDGDEDEEALGMESFSATATSRFDQLIGALKQQGESHSSISLMLGYSGKNGKRDLLAVRGGRSKRVRVADACTVLEGKLRAGDGPKLRTLGGAEYKPDPAVRTAKWVRGDIRWRLEDFSVWVDDTLSAVLKLFFKWAIFEADPAQAAGCISRFAPTPARGSAAFEKLPVWRQKACFVAARTFADVERQYEKVPDCPTNPRTFQPRIVRAREGSGDDRGTVYQFISDAEEFMTLDLDLRYCLRVIAKERRVRSLFRDADGELLMKVRKLLADTYHGRDVPGKRINDACIAVLQVAHHLIRTVVPDTDNVLRAHLGSQIAQSRDRFPLKQCVRDTRHICAVVLLRTYRAVDKALRAIVLELPPDGTTSVTWRGEGMTQQTVVLRSPADVKAVLADADVDFMHLINALSKRYRTRERPWFEVDQRGTEAVRHGVSLDSLEVLKEVVASFSNFVTSYVAISLGYAGAIDGPCDELQLRRLAMAQDAIGKPLERSVLDALEPLWYFAEDALAVAE